MPTKRKSGKKGSAKRPIREADPKEGLRQYMAGVTREQGAQTLQDIVKVVRGQKGSIAENIMRFYKDPCHDELRERVRETGPSEYQLFLELGGIEERHPEFFKVAPPGSPCARFLFPDGSSIVGIAVVATKEERKLEWCLGWGTTCWCGADRGEFGHRQDCVSYFLEAQTSVEAEIHRLGIEVRVLTVTPGRIALSWGDRRWLFNPGAVIILSKLISSTTTSDWWELMVEKACR